MSELISNPLFDLQQAIYASKNFTRRRLHRMRMAWVNDAIARYAQPGLDDTAIEWGPGSGVYLPQLSRNFQQVVAADIESAYLSGIGSLSADLPNVRLLVDNLEDSRQDDNTFALVLCSEVLEHVPHPELAIRTLFRLLRPGGIGIVTTPQRYSVLELCCKLAFLPGVIHGVRLVYSEPILPTGHISLRTAASFSKTLVDCGFELLEQRRFGLYIPLLAELGGERGGRLIESIERRIADTPLSSLLWTQAYIVRKPPG